MNEPIFITGCARSGTSLVAGIINKHGAFGGDMREANPNNPRGMFENKAIVNVVKSYMEEVLEVDPMGQYPLADPSSLEVTPKLAEEWKRVIFQVLEQEGYTKGPWMYKGAKMPMLWPIWQAAFPQARWVVVRRPREAIIASCEKTSFMRKVPEDLGWGWWVDQHVDAFNEMWQVFGPRYREVWSSDIIKGRLGELKDVIDWLELPWDKSIVTDFVDPSLWHYE